MVVAVHPVIDATASVYNCFKILTKLKYNTMVLGVSSQTLWTMVATQLEV